MRILDDKNRLFGIANPIDLIAVAAVLVAAFVATNILFGNPVSRVASKDKTIEAVLRVTDLREFDEAAISEGDKVVRRGGNMGTLGEVVKVETRRARRDVPTDKGGLSVVESTLFEDVYITIRGKGDIRENGSFLGAEKVRTNMDLQVELPRFEASGRITSLEVVEE